jgi:hypothetical protein
MPPSEAAIQANKFHLFWILRLVGRVKPGHDIESPLLIPSKADRLKVGGPTRRHEFFQPVGTAASLPQS